MKHKNYREGEYAYHLWDFRESDFLEDPEIDVDQALRMAGEEAGHRQESYDCYLESDYWKRVRVKALAAAGYKCSGCGSQKNLQVHHKRYCRRFTELQNMHLLEVLCNVCHKQAHG